MRLSPVLLSLIKAIGCLLLIAGLGAAPGFAATEQPSDIPSWLKSHVGEGEGQIAPIVLQRARALYLQKVGMGENPKRWRSKNPE